MRLFFAVNIEDDVRGMIERKITASPLAKAPWRWIRRSNYHITLKFLGDVKEGEIGRIEAAATEAAQKMNPFRVSFKDFGGFPDLKKPRVLFYSAKEGAEELGRLASLVGSAMEPLGFPLEKRPFRAHLTLARVKSPVKPAVAELLAAMPAIDPEASSRMVDSFSLMQSELTPRGAIYSETGKYVLGG